MGTESIVKLVATKGLLDEQVQQIITLAKECEASDGFDVSVNLNVSMLQNRPVDQTNDFLYYHDGHLVGFLGIYAIVSQKQVEISGMVHPAYRRKGIFRALYAKAKAECEARQVTQILLVCNRESEAASAFAKASSATYQFSEYRLDYTEGTDAGANAASVDPRLQLRPATATDFDTLVAIGVSGFGGAPEQTAAVVTRNLSKSSHQCYLALYDAEPVGMITASLEEDMYYISGFCVKKELQGKGLGRKILSQTVDILKQKGSNGISLEVDVDNQNALSLYQSIGFAVVSVSDYYVG